MSNVSDLVSKLKQQAERKEERRLIQMRTAREKKKNEPDPPAKKQKVDDGKARRRDPEAELEALLAYSHPSRVPLQWEEPEPLPSTTILTKPTTEMKGHTSYLTFASLHPISIRQQLAAQEPRSRVSRLKAGKAAENAPTPTATDYDSDGMDEVMGTLTEEEIMALGAA
jgi:tRNA (adenine57-N1/adenine58-N1)-methyltransferase